jgi:hypothetical protein
MGKMHFNLGEGWSRLIFSPHLERRAVTLLLPFGCVTACRQQNALKKVACTAAIRSDGLLSSLTLAVSLWGHGRDTDELP